MIDLFKFQGKDRLKKIKDLSLEESDEICLHYKKCESCPVAVFFNSRPYCSDSVSSFRIDRILSMGGKFTQSEEVTNEAESKSL